MKSKSVKRIFTLFILCVLVFSSFNFSACNTDEDKEPIDFSDYLSESDRNKEIIEEPFDTYYVYNNRGGSNEFTEIKDLKAYLTTNHPNYTFLLIDTEDIKASNPNNYQTFYQVYLNNEGAPYIVTNASIDDKNLKHKPTNGLVAGGLYYDWKYMMLSYPIESTNTKINYKHYLVGSIENTSLSRACYLMQDETIAAICIYYYARGLVTQPEDSYIEEIFNKHTFYFQT